MIKDSWQYIERDGEGDLLKEATKKGVVNVARYYYHETVFVHNEVIAIGALLGEQHSFMHDLESFFWVLFWICIHYDAQGKNIGPTEFDS